MKKYIVSLLIFLIVIISANHSVAEEETNTERTSVTIGSDSDGRIYPSIDIPLLWNETFFSGLSYSGNKKSEQSDMTENSGDKAMIIEENKINLNLISMKKKKFSFGLNIGTLNIKKVEIGHGWKQFPVIGETEDTFFAFKNNVDIDVYVFSLSGDYTEKMFDDKLCFRFGIDIRPFSDLKVKYETLITRDESLAQIMPIKGTDREVQKASFEVNSDVFIELPLSCGLSLNAGYEYLPIHYKLNQSEIETVDERLFWNAKLAFMKKSMNGLMPVIGYGSEHTKFTYKKGDVTDDKEIIRKIIFGFEKRF